jgi:hypothetical protein
MYGAGVERLASRHGAQQRHLQRLSLGLGYGRERADVDVLEQVGQPRERERRVGAARPRGEDVGRAAGDRNSCVPQGRLPDPGRPLDEERAGLLAGEEVGDPRELPVATDDAVELRLRLA